MEQIFRRSVSFIALLCMLSLQVKAYNNVTISWEYQIEGGNRGLNGRFRICNNSGGALPASTYYIDFRWPSFLAFDGTIATKLGPGACDKVRFRFENWQLPANGSCNLVSSGKPAGAYTTPLIYPLYGIDNQGDTVRVINGGNQFIPKSSNQNNWTYDFDPNCFIPTKAPLCLGQAQLREWNDLWDVRVPSNRKQWALVSAHIATLFNNMVGAEVVSINYAFAQSMIEGRMGCDAGMTPPGGDNNPLAFNAGSTAAGCFQILAPGWGQLRDFYPTLMAPLNYNSIIANGNFVTAALSKALYDMTTFVKYEKISCANPIGFFVNSADPYAAEEILAYSYHEGPNGSEGALLNILKTNRAATITNNNIAKYLQTNYANASTQYSERMRNNLIQLENNFGVPGGNSALSMEAQTNWVGGSPPTGYEWHGCYDAPFTWAEISAYIDEAARLFWTANVPVVKTNVQAVFNSINGGAAVNYSQLAPVIDAIVLNFPAYSPDEGVAKNFFATACGSPTVTMTSCDKICPGQLAELMVGLMGEPPFSYTIQGPTGTLYTRTGIMTATDILRVDLPGTYKVISINDANGSVFLNCHNASAVVEAATGCALPVSMLFFNAEAQANRQAKLTWATTWEKNSAYFVIERSSNGRDFEALGQVQAAGNSSTERHYQWIDYNPGTVNYYRIRQVDIDLQEATTRVVSVNFATALQAAIIPNPSQGNFTVSIQNGSQAALVNIYDVLGKLIYTETVTDKLNVSGFPSGVYVVLVTSGTEQVVQRLVVE